MENYLNLLSPSFLTWHKGQFHKWHGDWKECLPERFEDFIALHRYLV